MRAFWILLISALMFYLAVAHQYYSQGETTVLEALTFRIYSEEVP